MTVSCQCLWDDLEPVVIQVTAVQPVKDKLVSFVHLCHDRRRVNTRALWEGKGREAFPHEY